MQLLSRQGLKMPGGADGDRHANWRKTSFLREGRNEKESFSVFGGCYSVAGDCL